MELSGVWKVSLYGDAAWRVAMTAEHVKSGHEPQLPPGADRAPWTFDPPFKDRGRLVFVVACTRAALLPGQLDERELHVTVDDRWDRLTSVRFWMTEPGVDLVGMNRPLGQPLPLTPADRCGWVLPPEAVDGEPESMSAGALIEPRSPATDNVSAPGLLVRGVRLG